MELFSAEQTVRRDPLLSETLGKDELNFAEFPLALISRRANPEVKTLVFKDTVWDRKRNTVVERSVTITGAADTGLPTTVDEEVMMALIQLSSLNGFKSDKVYFSRYELLRILGWDDNGYYYKRIKKALDTWLGVNIKWTNAWRDYAAKEPQWGNAGSVLIQRYELKSSSTDGQSFIQWSEQVFESFRDGNLKSLDYLMYRKLSGSVTKRLYRFLDKRFYNNPKIRFDLGVLGYEKIGISRNTTIPEIKRSIRAAAEELRIAGFIDAPVFHKRRAGEWDVEFKKPRIGGEQTAAEKPELREQRFEDVVTPAVVSPLEDELVKRHVSRGRAKTLVARCPEDVIRAQMEIMDSLMTGPKERRPGNPGGYLASAIECNYSLPENFKTKRELEEEEAVKAAKSAKKREVREAHEQQRLLLENQWREKEEKVREYCERIGSDEVEKLRWRMIDASESGELLRKNPMGKLVEAQLTDYIWNLLVKEGTRNNL